ncbi:MAG: UDP-glucose/GDP-mannose dehydrogenase family protein [Candidatus Omnitrophica bacterium]|nr:UDP-glucose/GDP-mannose dehydrogenase family protein [Candidatus Omnitrophota bacterium]
MKAKSDKKNTKKYNICVVGAGHVGLVAAACFAKLGHAVSCVDSDLRRIKALKNNKMPFYEPDLECLVKKGVKEKNLSFLTSLVEGVRKAQVIFIAVGTPPQKDGSADLSSVENVAQVIAGNLNSYKLIISKSTVPVQTGKKIKETISRYKKSSQNFEVASNPEFLREGKAIYDFFYPDRIVIGVESSTAEHILRDIYSKVDAPIIVTDVNTAELIKHASNSFLATKISFINAVSRICDLAGADISKITQAMGMDKRIGRDFLNAGIGYGGFCFPKDLEAFSYISKKLGYDFDLLKEVKNINEGQRKNFVEKVKERLWIIKNKKIAVLGLAFKPDTDDMRFAPSVDIINFFLKEGAHLTLYDPQAKPEAVKLFSAKGGSASGGKAGRLKFSKGPYEAIKGSDCLCLLTEWGEFKKLNLEKVKRIMRYPLIADGRNFFDKNKVCSLGFEYIGMGMQSDGQSPDTKK